MLTVKTTHPRMTLLITNEFTCPMCGNSIAFYVYSPIRCHSCRALIPKVYELLTSKRERIIFHKKNIT